MHICEEIISIVVDSTIDEELEESKAEMIEALIEKAGWSEVQTCLLRILGDNSYAGYWLTIAEVLWGAVLDKRELPADRVIALLYYRLPPGNVDHEENLVWSITSKLKGVGYLSDYDPLQDPAVQRELSRLRGI